MATVRTRREPPPFRRVEVHRVEPLSPRMVRVTFRGPELQGLDVELPAASVRLLLPSPEAAKLIVPEWEGNEFLLPDGERPVIRTFTPRRVDSQDLELDLDIVVHDGGTASEWVEGSQPGDEAAISGPGRGYTIDLDADAFLLAGDEAAIPAMSQLLEWVPTTKPVSVLVEVAQPDARIELPPHPQAIVQWYDLPPGAPPGDALVGAVRDAGLSSDVRVWAAGEAGAVQRIRRHLFDERDLPRSRAAVRGYWKHGRRGNG